MQACKGVLSGCGAARRARLAWAVAQRGVVAGIQRAGREGRGGGVAACGGRRERERGAVWQPASGSRTAARAPDSAEQHVATDSIQQANALQPACHRASMDACRTRGGCHLQGGTPLGGQVSCGAAPHQGWRRRAAQLVDPLTHRSWTLCTAQTLTSDAPEQRLHALRVPRRPHALGQAVVQHKRKAALPQEQQCGVGEHEECAAGWA